MIMTTTDDIPGQEIKETLGLVRANTVRARAIGNDILASLRGIVGGEVREYAELLARSREDVLLRMEQRAESLGATAIVGIRFSTSMISSGSAEILGYGTAVISE